MLVAHSFPVEGRGVLDSAPHLLEGLPLYLDVKHVSSDRSHDCLRLANRERVRESAKAPISQRVKEGITQPYFFTS